MADAYSSIGESGAPGGATLAAPSTGAPGTDPRLADALQLAPLLAATVSQVVLGDPAPVRLAVAAFVAGGHVLFEDTPGTGKTLLCKALAVAIGGSFGRVQGTTDLLPSDVTGVSIYDSGPKQWEFRPGPVFHHVVLVDELNRATPRTQSALLEAMAERQVTVDGTTHPLLEPFFVVATQNPAGDLGTFPLVAGQRDRFTLSLSLGPPGRAAELRLVRGDGGEPRLATTAPVAPLERWIGARAGVEAVHLSDAVATYGLDIVDAVRRRIGVQQAISTRAALALLRVAKGHAVTCGRVYASPDDIQAVAPAALGHRLLESTNGNLQAARQLVFEAGSTVPVPPPG